MNVAFEDSFGKVWSDDHTPNVFTLLTHIPPPTVISSFAETHRTLTKILYKKFGEAYLISDFSRVNPK